RSYFHLERRIRIRPQRLPYTTLFRSAGTRVAGHAVVSLERFKSPRKLHSKQAIRAANFVLQSGDPGGINAAGPGANVGQGGVFKDRKSTRLNSSHVKISYAVFCLKKK